MTSPAEGDESEGPIDPSRLDPSYLDPSKSIELVRRIQSGERAALDALFERYRPRLRRIVRAQLGTRLQRQVDEDDVLQEVFLVATRKLPEFEPAGRASLLHWFAKIALNEIRNRVAYHSALKRDPEREVRLALDSASQAGVRVPAAQPSPSQRAAHAEMRDLVDAEVRRLEPPEYRDVIRLRDYEQESWEHIRERLDRPTVEAAQELYRRAHQKLRESLRRHLEP